MANGSTTTITSNGGMIGAAAVSGSMVAGAAADVATYYLQTPEPIKASMTVLIIFLVGTLVGWITHLATRVAKTIDQDGNLIPDAFEDPAPAPLVTGPKVD